MDEFENEAKKIRELIKDRKEEAERKDNLLNAQVKVLAKHFNQEQINAIFSGGNINGKTSPTDIEKFIFALKHENFTIEQIVELFQKGLVNEDIQSELLVGADRLNWAQTSEKPNNIADVSADMTPYNINSEDPPANKVENTFSATENNLILDIVSGSKQLEFIIDVTTNPDIILSALNKMSKNSIENQRKKAIIQKITNICGIRYTEHLLFKLVS